MLKEFVKRWMLPPGVSELVYHSVFSGGDDAMQTQLLGQIRTAEEKAILDKNLAIKDKHKGERCFILGAGSSISKQDLKKLVGERVISISNTFVHPDFPLFRPIYHAVPSMIRQHRKRRKPEEFVPWLVEMEQKTF